MLKELQDALLKVENKSGHCGYWYSVQDILTILICGLLCRIEDVSEIHEWSKVERQQVFFKEVFGINKIPCRAQFYNILSTVDSKFFEKVFVEWMQQIVQGKTENKTIAIDGKSIRSTSKLSHDGSIIHIASAIISDSGLIIGSQECIEKMGEPEAFRNLIEMLDIKDSVVVADALHCRTKSAESVINAQADYLFVVKDNNKGLKQSIEDHVRLRSVAGKTQVEKNGGRIESRTPYLCNNIESLYNKELWKNVSCVGAIHREFESNGETSNEWHYYISSANLTPETLLQHARMEWRVESMHWLLDVHFSEDKTRICDMKVQKNLNIMRKIVLNLVRIYKESLTKNVSMASILRANLFDIDQLRKFITYFRTLAN